MSLNPIDVEVEAGRDIQPLNKDDSIESFGTRGAAHNDAGLVWMGSVKNPRGCAPVQVVKTGSTLKEELLLHETM
ncbi:MAG: hypothetical protein HN796_07870 [Gemmatimonadetes bacterium]|jgi:hypothetical protein|nr:hypothetical protein [Gemmatimonadota bacterium]